MIRFLFWNLNKKPLTDSIVRITRDQQVDVLIFAEIAINPVEVLERLNEKETQFHYAPGRVCKKIEVFTNFSSQFIEPISETARVSIRRLRLPAREEILLVMAHLPSKLHYSNESQAMELTLLARLIQETEERVGHTRTVLVGDLNMNPFEEGVVAAAGLHAVMSRKVAEREQRIIQQRSYPFFYNPMWGHLGDRGDTPSGTFYYERAEQVNFYWNMFDQLLLRPSLLPAFKNEDLEILTHCGTVSLLNKNGLPDTSLGSDHLPIIFALNL